MTTDLALTTDPAEVGLDAATPFEGGVQMNLGITMEVEGQEKPAMAASILFRRYV